VRGPLAGGGAATITSLCATRSPRPKRAAATRTSSADGSGVEVVVSLQGSGHHPQPRAPVEEGTAIGLWTSSQVAARVYPRAGPRRMAVLGLAGVTVIFCLFGLTTGLATSAWLIRGLAFCSGSAIAWCVIAVQAASFTTISPGRHRPGVGAVQHRGAGGRRRRGGRAGPRGGRS
jgi:hypothetical protein